MLTRRLVAVLLFVGCTACGDTCPWAMANGIVSGSGSLSQNGAASQATDFQWRSGLPDTPPIDFVFAFGDATIECRTQSTIAAMTSPTPIAQLQVDGNGGSACQVAMGSEVAAWIGGTITVTSDGNGNYEVRLDARPTVVGDVTVELDGLAGSLSVIAEPCGGPGSFWF